MVSNKLSQKQAQVVRRQFMPEDWEILHTEIAATIRARNASKAAQLVERDISWGVITFSDYTEGEDREK